MAEAQVPPPQAAGPLDPLPENVSIPAALIEDWRAFPPQATPVMELRRADLDHGHASINRCIEAQNALRQFMTSVMVSATRRPS